MPVISLSRTYESRQGGAPLIDQIDTDIFTKPFDAPGRADCQWGVDIDRTNVARVLGHEEAIRETLGIPSAKPLFQQQVHFYKPGEDFPADGSYQRTARFLSKGEETPTLCVFFNKSGQGPLCGLRKYAEDNGMAYETLVPQVCAMYPATFDQKTLMVSETRAGGQSVYQAAREGLQRLFGDDFVHELDEKAKAYPFTPPKAELPAAAAKHQPSA